MRQRLARPVDLTRMIMSFANHKEGTICGAVLGLCSGILLLLVACLWNVLTRSSTRRHQRDSSALVLYRCCVLLMACWRPAFANHFGDPIAAGQRQNKGGPCDD
jgi:hypothetical protein